MADYGLKVSQPGFEVLSCTDKQLVYSSEFGTFRVYAFGSGSVTVPNPMAVTTVSITHSLGYRPAFAVYSQIYDAIAGSVTTGYYLMSYTDPFGGDGSIEPYCDSTYLKIRYGAVHAPSGSVMAYRYFIYYNQAR